MTQPAHRIASYKDLLDAPEHLVAEILFGRLVTRPRFTPRHAIAATALLALLGSPSYPTQGGSRPWIFLNKPEVHLGPHVVVPDGAAWLRKRLTLAAEAAWIDIAPDWVCDFSAPAMAVHDCRERRTVYAKVGIQHLWHLDPDLRMLEVFELRDGKWLLLDVFHDDAEVAAPPFSEPSFRLGLLWPFDPPRETQG